MAAPHSDHDPIKARLTSAAQSYADRHGIAATLLAMACPRNSVVGDGIVFVDGNSEHRFTVLRRDWVRHERGWRLELTLDQPFRRRAPR